ncbi:DNA-3-methyladenine glycosylase family protein [Anabaena lutea]|jgi:DNA-3-methyladenine glycosylase II|uniref:DNA-3-methyladenine glycosylase II n=1 Tax=Anabaena lutea FACHB-196 TaxID=2692881 RepID=A0ABR8FGL1_9NOST|nr:DNA-3-methyladenine glycosylase [Anabaena lutea]MBD2568748.1 DNA-3-methyladenine glycosylase 2 family protein [Anabaena lutea FACHB-196]
MNYVVAIDTLKQADPILAEVIEQVGECRLNQVQQTGDLLSSLCRSIIYQQLSGKAATTIHQRFLQLYTVLTPSNILNTPDDILREVGISRPKISYLKDLAQRFDKLPTIDDLLLMDDENIIKILTEVKGIGRWTVQMLLMFRLHRWDVLPVDDLGIRNAIHRLYSLPELPNKLTVEQLGENWKPYRTIACWYLWSSLSITKSEKL